MHAGAAQDALGTGLIRDGNGPRALETLVRYRGSVLAELFRALAALKLLQAESREFPREHRAGCRPGDPAAATRQPNEPEKAGWINHLGVTGGCGGRSWR